MGQYRRPWGDMQVMILADRLTLVSPQDADPSATKLTLVEIAPHRFRTETDAPFVEDGDIVTFELDPQGRAATRRRCGGDSSGTTPKAGRRARWLRKGRITRTFASPRAATSRSSRSDPAGTTATSHPRKGVVFCCDLEGRGHFDLCRQGLSDSTPQILPKSTAQKQPEDFSPDGRWLLFTS